MKTIDMENLDVHTQMESKAVALARFFHEAYEELAPWFGYTTREASQRPFHEIPEKNRLLMIAVAANVLTKLDELYWLDK